MKISRKLIIYLLLGVLVCNLEALAAENNDTSSVDRQKRLFSSSIKESLKETYLQKTKRQFYWTENYTKAAKISKEKQKFLLLAFVGSDWCPWSQKLENEVLTQPNFAKPLKDDFILVWIDFPENSVTPSDRQETNQYLKEKFQVKEVPTLVVLDEMGEQVSSLGYLTLEADAFAMHIRDLITEYKDMRGVLETSDLSAISQQELQSLYHKAKHLGCQKHLEEIMQAGLKKDNDTFFLLEHYENLLEMGKIKDSQVLELRKKIAARDPKNIKGTHLKLAMLEFQKNSNNPKKRDRSNAAIEPLVEYIKEFGKKDQDNLWRIEMMIAQYFFSKGIVEKALKYANASYESAPDSAKAEIALSIDYLKTQQLPQ